MASSRQATSSALRAGSPQSSCAAHRSAVTACSPGPAAARDTEVLTFGDSTARVRHPGIHRHGVTASRRLWSGLRVTSGEVAGAAGAAAYGEAVDGFDPDAAAAELTEALRPLGSAERAAQEKRYLKSDL